ncbi:MAG: tail fiber domain-containing protein [Acidobacteriota bacterium]
MTAEGLLAHEKKRRIQTARVGKALTAPLSKKVSIAVITLALTTIGSAATFFRHGPNLTEITYHPAVAVIPRGSEAPKFATPSTPTEEALGASTTNTSNLTSASIQTLITDALRNMLAQGLLTGPTGPQGPQGSSGLVNNGNGQTTAVVGGQPIFSYIPAVPQNGFSGTSLAGFGQLSAASLIAGQTTLTANLTGTSAVFSGSLNVFGQTALATTTLSGLTVSGPATFTGSTTIAGLTVTGFNPGLTVGSVAFQGGAGLAQDNGYVFYDSTNHRLGLGTTTPSHLLTVAGNALFTGNAIIAGTQIVSGTLSVAGVSTLATTTITSFTSTAPASFQSTLAVTATSTLATVTATSLSTTGNASFAGNVGIGTTVSFLESANQTGTGVNASQIRMATAHRSGAPWVMQAQTTTFGGPSTENDALFSLGFNFDGSGKVVNTGGISGGRKQYMMFEHDYYQSMGDVANRLDEWHYDVEDDAGVSHRLFHYNFFPANGASSLGFVGKLDVYASGGTIFTGTSTSIFSDRVVLPTNGFLGITKQDGTTQMPILSLDTSDRAVLGAPLVMNTYPIRLDGNLDNSSARPALTTVPIPGEVWGHSRQTPGNPDGFLRLSAGGGSTPNTTKSYIDISGFSNVSDMNGTVVMGTNGVERLRLSSAGAAFSTGATLTGDLQLSGNILTVSGPTLQPYTSNANLNFGLRPSGNGTQAALTIYDSSTGGNQYGQLQMVSSGVAEFRIGAGANSGNQPDIVFSLGSERMRIVGLTGNVGIGTTTPTLGPLTMASGAYVSAGGTWTNASDRNLKEGFATVTPADILQKIDGLSITQWNYKSEGPTVQHIGPVAQDFYAAFHLGNSSTSISTIDPAGIALLGIQALDQKIEALQGGLIANATTVNLTVYSPSNFSGDSVGEAEISAGQTSVRVTFSQAFAYQPIVTITPTALYAGHFWVDHTDSTGFTIELDQTDNSDLIFNWHSFASPSARLFVSGGETQSITLILPVIPAPPTSSSLSKSSGSGDNATETVVTTATSTQEDTMDASNTPLMGVLPSPSASSSTPALEQPPAIIAPDLGTSSPATGSTEPASQ